MSKLVCNCLNVALTVKEGDSEVTAGSKVLGKDEGDEKNIDSFFGQDVTLVSLSVAGIEVQQKLLLKEREVSDYKVFKCINCDMSTYAIHKFKGLDRVVVSKDMINASAFSKLRESADYSPVFKIILKQNQDVTKIDKSHQAKMFHKSLSEANSKVNDIVKRFLVIEEEAMQEKIRIYTQQQQHLFEKLQKKITADKEIFLRLINKKEEHALQSSLTDAMNEAVLSKSNSLALDLESQDLAPDLPEIKGMKMRPNRFLAAQDSSSSTAPPRTIKSQGSNKSSSSNSSGKSKPMSMGRSSSWKSRSDEDALFDIEGFHESKSCEPFFESDEESSDSNSLDSSGGYSIPNRGQVGNRIYATSVPVGIPMFRSPNRGSFESTDETDMHEPPSPGKIAESMKALARSLHDSTSIFGDLPTPRYK